MNPRYVLVVLVVAALTACKSMPRDPVERILEDGDCGTVPEIERLTVTVSDRGTQVEFRWRGTRFAGTVLSNIGAPPRDASYGSNQAGEWNRRFPNVSASTAVPGSFLGFPARSDPRAGVLAAAVYDEPFPGPGNYSRSIVVVDLKTRATQLVPLGGRVGNIAWSPKGEFLAILEIAPTSRLRGWRDLFGLSSAQPAEQSDVHAAIYSASGVIACRRLVIGGLPAPNPSVVWE